MGVFLIQTNGREISDDAKSENIDGAKEPTFVDEPLRHHRYFNADPYWKDEGFGRRDAWESAKPGDRALLYCSPSVDDHPKCLSHVLPIESKQFDPEGAVLNFASPIEIEPKLGYQEIHQLVDAGEFSKAIGYCGQQGVNFTQVATGALKTVKERTDPVPGPRDL